MRHCQSALSAAGFRDGLGFLLHLVCNGDIKLEITCDYVKPAKHCKGIRHTAVFQHHAACCHKQICGCGRHAPARRQRRLALSSTWGPSQKRGKKGRAFFPRSYFRPAAISAHGYFRPAAMSARARRSATRAGRRRRTLCCALCPLMLYPFRLTAPPTVLRIAQAAEDFVPEKFL